MVRFVPITTGFSSCFRGFVALISLLSIAAFPCPAAFASSLQPQLIGGVVAQQDEFRSTVQLTLRNHVIDFEVGLCTAAKIGPHHFLTAAHCLYNKRLTAITISAIGGDRLNAVQRLSYRFAIRNISIHPSYDAYCQGDCKSKLAGIYHQAKAVDAAVLSIAEETPDIPIAPLAFTSITPRQEVTIVGYGCEDNIVDQHGQDRLKYQTTEVLFANSLYFSTPGARYAPDNTTTASLCPGDSGGPVYAWTSRGYAVVGVNSYYTFAAGESVSRTNMHTAISTGANVDVAQWLEAELQVDPAYMDKDAGGCGAVSGHASTTSMGLGGALFALLGILRLTRRNRWDRPSGRF